MKCGKGTQTREAYCQGPEGKIIMDTSCDRNKKETAIKECYRGRCGEVFQWKTGEWMEVT